MAGRLGDLSGFKNYAEWQAANRAAGGPGVSPEVEGYFNSGGGSQQGFNQAFAPTTEQQQTARQGAGTYGDDSADAGNWQTGDPYLDQLRSGQYAGSEDWRRFSNAQLKAWEGYYIGNGQYRNAYGDIVAKPDDVGPNTPAGYNGTGDFIGGGGGGGGAAGGGGGGASSSSQVSGGTGTAGPVPQFEYTPFQPPSYEDAFSDPGYQFALDQGNRGIERSAAARGVLRTGGTLQDLAKYNQDMAATQYGNVYNRALQTWGAQYQGEKDAFAPQYGAWETMYGGDLSKYLQNQNLDYQRWNTRFGGDLSKYLQREQNIFGLLNAPPPAPPTFA